MRPLILIASTIAALIVLPRLADNFREPQPKLTGNASVERLSDKGAGHASSSGVAASEPASVQAVPVSLKNKEASPRGAVVAPAVPASEDELIVAIQKELARLGYYDGPITARWTNGVRSAVRRFTGTKRSKPSQRLLAALQAAKPEPKRSVRRDGPTLNLQTAEGQPGGKAQETVFNISPAPGVLSDGYLPPWQELRGKDPQHAATRSGEPQARTKRRRSAEAGPVRKSRRSYARHERGRRKSMFANARYSWPDVN